MAGHSRLQSSKAFIGKFLLSGNCDRAAVSTTEDGRSDMSIDFTDESGDYWQENVPNVGVKNDFSVSGGTEQCQLNLAAVTKSCAGNPDCYESRFSVLCASDTIFWKHRIFHTRITPGLFAAEQSSGIRYSIAGNKPENGRSEFRFAVKRRDRISDSRRTAR